MSLYLNKHGMMIKIGITGGIGSGKSIVSRLLEVLHIPVFIADTESKKITSGSPVIREKLIRLLGPEVFQGGNLNKTLLAAYIFGQPEHLKEINQIIHPEVLHRFQEWTHEQRSPICAIESAILIESGFNRFVDFTCMVYAPEDLRIKRVMRRDELSLSGIERRIASQMPDNEKCLISDYIIYNDDSKAIIPQVENMLSRIN